MERPLSIVISNASGQLGRGVVEEALQRVDPDELILVTRTPAALANYADLGASVRFGDFDQPATLREAYAGGDRLLLISAPDIGARVRQHADAIDAAADAGVRFAAYTSFVNPIDANPAEVVPSHIATEEKLRASGLDWTFVRNSVYADFEVANLAVATDTGTLITNVGSGTHAYVSRADCAAAAAAVITGDGHAGRTYDVTGPELIGAGRRAEIFSAVGGRRVEVVDVGDDEFASVFADVRGLPIAVGRLMASIGRATREGQLEVLSDDFEELVGRPPQDLHSVLSLHAGSVA
jgi:NAD(P)H dehydrogenase (quinone)